MKKSLLHRSLAAFCGLLLLGCVSVPKEAADLSQSVSKDLAAYRSSHLQFVGLYFDKIEDDINGFVDSRIAPGLISAMVRNDLRDSGGDPASLFATLARLQADPSEENAADAVVTIGEFQTAINAELESYRKKLLEPVRQKRSEVEKRLADSYDVTMAASSSVTAYLESAAKVREKQDALLSRVGAAGLNEEIASQLASLSSKIGTLSDKPDALTPRQLLDSLSCIIEKNLKTIDNGK